MNDDQLPAPTLPTSVSVNLVGFENEEQANRVANETVNCTREISRFINASRLDGITISHDYERSLLNLDRGVPNLAPLARTNDAAIGVAMSPAVIRNDIVKGHMILFAPLAIALLGDNEDAIKDTIYILAHELGHIHDLRMRDIAFPNTILQKSPSNYFEACLSRLTACCWEEYIACKLSAPFSPRQTQYLNEIFVDTLTCTKVQVDEQINSYRSHGDINHLFNFSAYRYGSLMKYASYLIGHIHGVGSDIKTELPETFALVNNSYFQTTFHKLENDLTELHTSYGNWHNPSVYDNLKQTCLDCMSRAGLELIPMNDGQMYVGVPFRPHSES